MTYFADLAYILSVYFCFVHMCVMFIYCAVILQDYTTQAKIPALLSSGLQTLSSLFFPWEYRKKLALVALLFPVLRH